MFRHECKKLVKNPSVWGLLVLLLLANGILGYAVNNRTLSAGIYREVWGTLEQTSPEEASSVLGQMLENSASEERNTVIRRIQKEVDGVQNYPAYREQILQNAASMRIFSPQGSFAEKNITATEEHFKNMGTVSVTAAPSAGVEHLFSGITPVFLFFFLCYLGYLLFIRDRETGIEPLLRTTRNGAHLLCFCKAAAHVTWAVLVTILFYFFNLLQQHWMYGLGDLSRSIQSVLEYRSCGWLFSVREFIGYGILLEVGIAVVMAFVIDMVCAATGNKIYMLLVLLLAAAVSVGNLAFVKLDSLTGWTKYLNPCFFSDAGEVLGKYVNLNIANQKCPYLPMLLAVLATVMIGFAALLFAVFARRKKPREAVILPRRKAKNRTWKFSLAYYERTKIQKESHLVLTALLLFAMAVCVSYQGKLLFDDEDNYYYYCYMKQLEGERTPEKTAELQVEKEKFDRIRSEYAKAAEEGSGDETVLLMGDEMRKYNGFLRALEKDRYLEETGWNEYVYEDGFYGLFQIQGNTRNKLLLLGNLIFCVLALSGVHAADEERGISPLLKLTKNGEKKKNRITLACALKITVFGYFILYLPQFIVFFKLYGFCGLTAPAQCIHVWTALGIGVPIWAWILFYCLLRFVLLAVWMGCILAISHRTKNVLFTILFCFVIVTAAGIGLFVCA